MRSLLTAGNRLIEACKAGRGVFVTKRFEKQAQNQIE
jgi:hypothetical protein